VSTQSRLSVLFLNIGHAYDHFFMLIYPTAVLALGREWGLPYDELLRLATAGFVIFAAATLPAGWLGDRWSRPGMMAIFFIGIGAASVLTGLASTTFEIAAGLALIGLFAAIYHPVANALLVSDTDRPGRRLGVNGVFGNLGVAFAALATGALAELMGWRTAFILPGAVAIVTGIFYVLLLRRWRVSTAAKAPAQPTAVVTSRSVQIRVFIFIAAGALFGGDVFTAMTVVLPKIFEERLAGIADGTFAIGTLVSIVFGVAAFSQIVVGHLIDRYPVRWIVIPITAAQAALLLAMGSASGLSIVFLALPLMVVVFGEIPISDWLVARYVGAQWRSRIYAVSYLLSLGVSAVIVPLIAWIHAQAGGFMTLFWLLAACAAIVGVCALLLPGRRPRTAPSAAAVAAE
jgi:MFS family permease